MPFSPSATIGIMSAMPQEADLILNQIKEQEIVQVGIRQFVKGTFEGTPVVFSPSGWGKVSAAVTATLLIAQFHVDEIVFTGVAGGGQGTQIGDIVIGSSYLQHDVDLRPIFPQFFVYSLGEQILQADAVRISRMKAAADRFFQAGICFPDFGITAPKVHVGVIASGDMFIGKLEDHQTIVDSTKKLLPNGFQAIEMEGAAVAQVCKELHVPFVVIRTISDKADGQAAINFQTFVDQIARVYSFGVLKEYVRGSQSKYE